MYKHTMRSHPSVVYTQTVLKYLDISLTKTFMNIFINVKDELWFTVHKQTRTDTYND